jgi:hypothetical protein
VIAAGWPPATARCGWGLVEDDAGPAGRGASIVEPVERMAGTLARFRSIHRGRPRHLAPPNRRNPIGRYDGQPEGAGKIMDPTAPFDDAGA